MKIDYISDIHLDFYIAPHTTGETLARKTLIFIQKILPDNPGDIIIVAGDISHYNTQSLYFLTILKDFYNEVVVVYGNHDMYLINEKQQKKYNFDSRERIQELKIGCKNEGIQLLDGDIIEIGQLKIKGLCGWYDLRDGINYLRWLKSSNDSNYISPKVTGKFAKRILKVDALTPKWNTLDFYDEQYRKLKDFPTNESSIDILITHVPQLVAPRALMNPEFRHDPNNAFFYVDNFKTIKESGCKYYIHGHVHNIFEYNLGGVEVRCNPYGYPGEDTPTKIKQFIIEE